MLLAQGLLRGCTQALAWTAVSSDSSVGEGPASKLTQVKWLSEGLNQELAKSFTKMQPCSLVYIFIVYGRVEYLCVLTMFCCCLCSWCSDIWGLADLRGRGFPKISYFIKWVNNLERASLICKQTSPEPIPPTVSYINSGPLFPSLITTRPCTRELGTAHIAQRPQKYSDCRLVNLISCYTLPCSLPPGKPQ